MVAILVSGPAGAGKSQRAAELLQLLPQGVLADFQSLYAAILGLLREPDGRYPERLQTDAYALQMAELLRHTVIRQAREQELDIVATNSDGDPTRRIYLLNLLGPGGREEIIDPGISVVTTRLERNGVLSENCDQAIKRWYGRLQRERQEARRG